MTCHARNTATSSMMTTTAIIPTPERPPPRIANRRSRGCREPEEEGEAVLISINNVAVKLAVDKIA